MRSRIKTTKGKTKTLLGTCAPRFDDKEEIGQSEKNFKKTEDEKEEDDACDVSISLKEQS